MLDIPKEFFLEEERDGFLISQTMKRGWAIQLTLLDQILEIAKKHSLTVFMDYGSSLGAIRHHGYIPWDDDLDICVKRADYTKLIKALKDELPAPAVVYSFSTTENYSQPKAFVANRPYIDIGIDPKEAELTKGFFDCPYVTGIDICPLDYTAADEEQFQLIKQIYVAVYDLAMSMDDYIATGEFDDYLSQIEDLLKVSVPRDGNTRAKLWQLADDVAMITNKKEAGAVMWYPNAAVRSDDVRIPLSAVADTVWVDFEFIKVPMAKDYDTFLKVLYGEDYMTPRFTRGAHEYPFFKAQDKKILHNSWIGQFGDVY